MNSLKILLVTIFISCSAMAGGNSKLETVENIDIQKYLGKWFEIARFEQRFQKDCEAVTAEYSLRRDGDLKVLNSCRQDSINGELKQSTGRAWIKDKKTNAKLRVQFFLKNIKIKLLSGKYWVLALGENYEYSVVGDPSRKYLWILSRTPKMDSGLYDELVAIARGKGFEVKNLRVTKH
ncbi:MAG: apolipoprotein D and lipocalin family protein [Thermoproteota archaeon]|jgi:apolipoprotein D and lipocalin family protein